MDIEVTNHGTTALEIPLVFMELGSTKKEWTIKEAGELVGKSILKAIAKYSKYYKYRRRT